MKATAPRATPWPTWKRVDHFYLASLRLTATTQSPISRAGIPRGGPAIFFIYAEISIGFQRIEEEAATLRPEVFERRPLPWEEAFLAGKCFPRYRGQGGTRRSPLPDFFIGAHAAVEGLTLLTRDPTRYRSYFPSLPLIAP